MTVTFIKHCETFYNALNDRAIDKELPSGGTARIFAGSYTEVWKATGIAQTYYSPVRKALEKHSAIEILQKGGRQADTVIHLKGLPSEDEWQIDGWDDARGLTDARRYATLALAVREIKDSLGGLNIVKGFQEIESRLVALDEKLKEVVTRLDEIDKTAKPVTKSNRKQTKE